MTFLSFGFAAAAGADPSPTVNAREIIAIGQQAPGFEPGARIELFGDRPRIDADGNVAFSAVVRRADGTTAQAIFRDVAGLTELLFASGDAAPGTSAKFVSFPVFPDTPRIHAGRIAFLGGIDGAQGLRGGIWTDRFGSFVPLFVQGEPGLDALPALPSGARIVDFRLDTRADKVFLRGRFAESSMILNENNGLWRNADGAWQAVLVKGQPAPAIPGAVFDGDTPGGGTLFFYTSDPTGRVLVQAWVDGDGITDDDDEGLWVEGANGLQLLVREGDLAPVTLGAGGGNRSRGGGKGGKGGKGRNPTFGPNPAFPPTFGADRENLTPAINERGNVVFGAVLRSKDGRSNSVWTNRPGSLELIALGTLGLVGSGPGSQAPGFAQGVPFAAFLFGQINAADVIAFQGWALEGSALDLTPAIWWDPAGELVLAAAVDRSVPPVPGAVYAELELEALTEANDLLVHARFEGAGIGLANDRALLHIGTSGVAIALRDGSQVVSDGQIRQLASFVPGIGITDNGDGVAELRFADQSGGLYVFNRLP